MDLFYALSLLMIIGYAATDHIIDRKNLYPSVLWHFSKLSHHFFCFFSGSMFTIWAIAQGDKWNYLYIPCGLIVLGIFYWLLFEYLMRKVKKKIDF